VSINDSCVSLDAVAFSLTTSVMDEAPIFSAQKTTGGECVWSIGTIVKDRISPIVQIHDDLWAVAPTAGPDDTYWLVVGGRYINTSRSATPTYLRAFNKGFTPTSIGSTANGQLYAIEQSPSKSDEKGLRLVSIANGTSVAIPFAGWTENLLRGSDGNLYFRLFEKWHCHIFEIDGSGTLFDKATCPWENGRAIAVDIQGAIWQPGLLSIVQYDPSGHITKSIGPIAPVPCTITNTAALEPRLITADQRGAVWFVYGQKLWRVDDRGNLSAINLPSGRLIADAMVETSDGTLWLTTTDWNHGGAFYRFVPAMLRGELAADVLDH